MNDWVLAALIFWGAFWFDAVRRAKRARHAVRDAWLAGRGRAGFSGLHLAPLLPWQARFWADDPTVAFSPEGILNLPAASAGRPADAPSTVSVFRWEDIAEVAEYRGWLHVNGKPFAAVTAALPARRLLALAQKLAPLPVAARATLLRREIALWFRPAHWRRRARVARHHTRTVADLNTITLLLAVALTAAALKFWQLSWPAVAEKLAIVAPRFALLALGTYVAGVVFAVLAARRLARWTRPGMTGALVSAALFPPQALRARTTLTDALLPAPHPLLPILLHAGAADRRAAVFNVLADAAHPAALPADAPPAAAEIRRWFSNEVAAHIPRLLAATGTALDPAALLAPPAPDSPASCAYCPRCHAQFVRADGRCPHGVTLLPLK